jgi:DNA polymerase/3'-5' exonuclease PolX
MSELEKMDLLRERMGVSYAQAKEALEKTGGDVTEALVFLEKAQENERSAKWDGKLEQIGNKIVNQIKSILHQGNVTKIRLKKGDRVLLEIPATLGAIGIGGIFISPILAIAGVLGTVGAVIQQVKLEIVREDGQVESQDLDIQDADIVDVEPEETDPRNQ